MVLFRDNELFGIRGAFPNAAGSFAGLPAVGMPRRLPCLTIWCLLTEVPVEWGIPVYQSKIKLGPGEYAPHGGNVALRGWTAYRGEVKACDEASLGAKPYVFRPYGVLITNALHMQRDSPVLGAHTRDQVWHQTGLTNDVNPVGAQDAVWDAELHIIEPGSICTWQDEGELLKHLGLDMAQLGGTGAVYCGMWTDAEIEFKDSGIALWAQNNSGSEAKYSLALPDVSDFGED